MIKSIFLLGPITLLCISTCGNTKKTAEDSSTYVQSKHEIVQAAQSFLTSLTDLEKKACLIPFEDQERENWNFVPIKRRGLALQLMSNQQRELATAMLKVCLSTQGYEKVEGIRALESVLTLIEKRPPDNNYRNPDKYFVSIFGEPKDSTAWGWRFEGHHLSLNYTFANQQLMVTPQFMGTNPAEIPIGDSKGKRVLAEEEDQGRALVQSLDEAQLEIALLAKRAYPEIITGNDRRVKLETLEGLSYSQMTKTQQSALIDLIQLYLNNNIEEVAKRYWAGLQESGIEQMHFAWAGGVAKGEKHYYRIHSPRLLIEYDNTQNGGNHIHSVCRDPSNDFGEDVLRKHYQLHEH